MDILIKFLMYFGVGMIGFSFDLLVTFSLLKRKWIRRVLYANTIGFTIGICIKYYLNRIWTFQSHEPNMLLQFMEFMIIGLVGLLMVNYIVHFLHVKREKKFIYSKIISMTVFMVWSFTANYFVTFGAGFIISPTLFFR